MGVAIMLGAVVVKSSGSKDVWRTAGSPMRLVLFGLASVAFGAGAEAQAAGSSVTDSSATAAPAMLEAVAPSEMLGVELAPDHYDDAGYAESAEGLLVVELDPSAGPITMVRGKQPHFIEAQFVNTQRDGILLARKRSVSDVLPTGAAHEIAYGYGAIKRSLSAITLVEAQLTPHISDNQKSYELFPLRDLYVGAAFSLTGLRGEMRWIEQERYVAFGQVGLNVAALAGAKINRTYGAFAVPITLGGGIRYAALVDLLGSHWTTGAELSVGLGAADDDKETGNVIVLPGLFHELEWTLDRDLGVTDYRADPRPYNYGVHAISLKISAYADFFGGASSGILFDVLVGYRVNFVGPSIPAHEFKHTKITYASDRYVRRKLEEEQRRKQLEELRRDRGAGPISYPGD